MPEQPFFVVKGLCADYQSGQGIFQGRAQPPDASVPSTFTDVGDAIHHTPAPRTATPGKQFIPRMLEIFNERYPEDVRLGRTVHAAAAAMTAAVGPLQCDRGAIFAPNDTDPHSMVYIPKAAGQTFTASGSTAVANSQDTASGLQQVQGQRGPAKQLRHAQPRGNFL